MTDCPVFPLESCHTPSLARNTEQLQHPGASTWRHCSVKNPGGNGVTTIPMEGFCLMRVRKEKRQEDCHRRFMGNICFGGSWIEIGQCFNSFLRTTPSTFIFLFLNYKYAGLFLFSFKLQVLATVAVGMWPSLIHTNFRFCNILLDR